MPPLGLRSPIFASTGYAGIFASMGVNSRINALFACARGHPKTGVRGGRGTACGGQQRCVLRSPYMSCHREVR
eukprot:171994-Prymnesium_polylepis.2